MNREETKRCIAVMQAYVDGAEVESCHRTRPNTWDAFPEGTAPAWDWAACRYRVKPQPKLRPWTYDEIVARMAKRPLLVRHKRAPSYDVWLVSSVTQSGCVYLSIGYEKRLYSLVALCDDFVQHDGSPCGVVE